jgi:hypothetical protein
MGEIVDLSQKRVKNSPYLSGECLCLQCCYEWVGVAPTGVMELQCPSCHTMKGVYKYGCEPDAEGGGWICNCGCYLFILSGTSQRMICWKCGSYQQGF